MVGARKEKKHKIIQTQKDQDEDGSENDDDYHNDTQAIIILITHRNHDEDDSENDSDCNVTQVYLSEGDTDQEEVTFKVIIISRTSISTSHCCKLNVHHLFRSSSIQHKIVGLGIWGFGLAWEPGALGLLRYGDFGR